jgi:predicted AlkP superfamily phosphohydrolase/phosphomutase
LANHQDGGSIGPAVTNQRAPTQVTAGSASISLVCRRAELCGTARVRGSNNNNAGAIRISVIGRDYGGLVHPGAEYRYLCDEITKAMYQLTDPVTGRAIIEEVVHLQEKYHGPFLKELPDLALCWDHSFPWNAIRSPSFGTLQLTRQDSRSGSHNTHGFVIATGQGIPAGTEMKGLSIYDIAPSVLRGAGVPIPESMDGRPELPLASD